MFSLETAARSLKVVPITAPVHSDVEIETAIVALGRETGGGLVVMPDAFMVAHRAPIILAAARNNTPAVYTCALGNCTFARAAMHTRSPLGVIRDESSCLRDLPVLPRKRKC